MSDRLPYAVLGATGQQGSAVVDHLLDQGVAVRALVRDPSAERARHLADRGVDVVAADQEDADSLAGPLTGVAGLFLMTTFAGDDGTEGEVRRGVTVVEAAAAAGVPLVVYASVGGAERHTGIPHFESKRRVEEALEAGDVPFKVVRPVFFMENLAGQVGEDVVRLPVPGDVPLQMVAVRDIGRVAGALLLDPTAIDGEAIEIAGDEVTLDGFAAAVGEQQGRQVIFEALPVDSLGNDDQEAMFTWFTRAPAYTANVAATRALVPALLDVPTWLRTVTPRD